MAHFHIDYSANIEEVIDMAGLCEAIRICAASIETFPLAGIRVRATRVDMWRWQMAIQNMGLLIYPCGSARDEVRM